MSTLRLKSSACLMGLLLVTALAPAAAALGGRPLSLFTLGLRAHHMPHSEQQQVLYLEDEMRQALLKGDASPLEKVLADDFLGVSANGTLSDRQQYLRRIGKREHQFTRIDVIDRKVRLQPASAIVVTTATVAGKLDTTPINGVYRYTRVWSREADGTWKLRNFEATRVTGNATDEMRHGVPVARSR